MKHQFLIILISLLTTTTMNAQEKLIYIGDPMCSWCYGFAPQLEKLVAMHKNQMEIELVAGGLRPYNEETINGMKDFLLNHWQDVNNASQQAFNYGILDRTDLSYDTEPACRAVVVVRHMNPEKEFEFFKLIQEAFYYQNKDLMDVASYDEILANLNLDKEVFRTKFNSDEYKELVKADFKKATELGVNSFPTLLYQSGDKLTIVARGYVSAEKVTAEINAAKK